jgi:hypothetical protein
VKRHAWWRSLEPVSAALPLGDGTEHRISWRAGKLILHDHDVEAEDVLLALGGEAPCTCLFVRDLFRGRGAIRAPARQMRLGQFRVQVARRPAAGGAPGLQLTPGAWQRQTLVAALRSRFPREFVPPELADVLDQTVKERFARLKRRAPESVARFDFEPTLRSRVEPALREALRRSRAHLRSYASLSIECTRCAPGDQSSVEGYVSAFGGFVKLALNVRWLNRVWLRGLACVDSYFVLDVDAPAPATALRGTAIRWERRSGGAAVPVATPCALLKLGLEWHLAWL